MKTLIIGFSIGHTVVSKAIKVLDRSRFSHVYIKWHSDSIDRDIIYQASGTMVNFMGVTEFRKHSTPVEEIKLTVTDDQFRRCLQFCIDNAGVPYGLKQLIGMGYVRVLRLFGVKMKNPLRDGRATYVCSELISSLLADAVDIKVPLDTEIAGPNDLYKFLKDNAVNL